VSYRKAPERRQGHSTKGIGYVEWTAPATVAPPVAGTVRIANIRAYEAAERAGEAVLDAYSRLERAVEVARSAGLSWAAIGEALGPVAASTAWRRFPKARTVTRTQSPLTGPQLADAERRAREAVENRLRWE
jgi:hypothetical protein